MEVTITLAALHPRPGALRATAEEIERATGLRVEIIGGTLMMSPPRRGKHAGVVYRLRERIRPHLPTHLVAVQVASIEMRDDPDDYVTPDLLVTSAGFLNSDEWLIDPHDTELAVEVISKSEKTKNISGKTGWYAVAEVPLLLITDPRDGSWALHSHPRDGSYRGVLRGKYGDSIPLPDPIGLALDTEDLPVYTT